MQMIKLILFITLLALTQGQRRRASLLQNSKPKRPPLTAAEKALINEGVITVKKGRELRDDPRWTHVETDAVTGIKVETMNYTREDNGKLMPIFKASSVRPYPPEIFFTALSANVSFIDTWNPIIEKSSVIENFKPYESRTKIIYQLLNPQAPLPLEPRSFLAVFRSEAYLKNKKPAYAISFAGVPQALRKSVQFSNDVKTAYLGPNTVFLERSKSNPKLTELSWIAILDLEYPDIDQKLVKLFERFNIVLYTEGLLNHVEGFCRKTPAKCVSIF